MSLDHPCRNNMRVRVGLGGESGTLQYVQILPQRLAPGRVFLWHSAGLADCQLYIPRYNGCCRVTNIFRTSDPLYKGGNVESSSESQMLEQHSSRREPSAHQSGSHRRRDSAIQPFTDMYSSSDLLPVIAVGRKCGAPGQPLPLPRSMQ